MLKTAIATLLSSLVLSGAPKKQVHCLRIPTDHLKPSFSAQHEIYSDIPIYTDYLSRSNSTTVQLPSVVDYRLSDNVVSPVKDQGACGSCWAFSSAESLEGQLGLNGHAENVSVQNFVDCVQLDAGCGGGWMDDALAYAEAHGVERESQYPYNATTQQCKADTSIATIRPSFYINVAKTDHALRTALVVFGPVSIALDATNNFMDYSKNGSKVFNDDTCDPLSPDHALLLVGYNNNDHYWIVKNSWNTDWGYDGYIYMNNTAPNLCGISSYATVPYIAPRSAVEEKTRVSQHLKAVVEL